MDTVDVLIKLIRKVTRSHETIKLLGGNMEFKECLNRMEQQLKR